jgi:hypothetical protein
VLIGTNTDLPEVLPGNSIISCLMVLRKLFSDVATAMVKSLYPKIFGGDHGIRITESCRLASLVFFEDDEAKRRDEIHSEMKKSCQGR